MKKFLVFIVFISLLQAKAQTSVYHPFPDSNAVWNFHYVVDCPIGSSSSPYAYYSITISGDTIINGTTYKKLYTPFVLAGNVTANCPIPSPGFQGTIRQDTLNRKVYIIPKYSTIEKLYFDFNWEEGDTITGALGNSQDTIVAIDSVLVGNSYRKRWLINSWYNTYVIEGIGSTYGLLSNSSYASDQPYYNLLCFRQDNQVLYPDTATVCEIITVSVPEVEQLYDLNIFPNPTTDEINISFNLEKTTDFEIHLFNSFGQKIKFIPIKKLAAGENKIKISLEDVPVGVYFLKINLKDKITLKKIIINR